MKAFGLVESSIGGTRIEPWSTPEGLTSCNVAPYVSSNPLDSNSYLYNAMIHPLHKFTIKGALWYQGKNKQIQRSEILIRNENILCCYTLFLLSSHHYPLWYLCASSLGLMTGMFLLQPCLFTYAGCLCLYDIIGCQNWS